MYRFPNIPTTDCFFSFSFQTGITYIAQVLKRNRTLKVLNLSENKLDVQCLVTIAEALVRLCDIFDIFVQPF